MHTLPNDQLTPDECIRAEHVKNFLITNVQHNYTLKELAKDYGNPLFASIIDPANSSNILSDLLDRSEKNKIITAPNRQPIGKITFPDWKIKHVNHLTMQK